MTQLLEKAIEKISKLSSADQNKIAKWLLDELESETEWEKRYRSSEDTLTAMAKEAIEEYKKGKTSKLNFKKL